MQEDLAYLSEVIKRINKDALASVEKVKSEDLIKQLKEFSSKLNELSVTIIASKEGTGITGESPAARGGETDIPVQYPSWRARCATGGRNPRIRRSTRRW